MITDEIEIKIREFYTKEDLFLSGIPMDYDSSGTTFALETAGMIELRGEFKGQQVDQVINPMKVELATISSDEDFNLYFLDEEGKNWDYMNPLHTDEISLDNLETPEVYEEQSKELQKKINVIKTEVAKIAKAKPVQPRKLDESKFSFDIDANKSQFPELSSFRNVIFEVGDENKGFTEEVYSKTWENLELKRLNNKYQVVLTKGNHVEKYLVYPALTGAEYTRAKSEFDKKFKVYDQKLSKKTKELKDFQKEYDLNKKKWEKAVAYSQNKEFKHNYENGNLKATTGVTTSKVQEKVIRIFEVKNFGVFNCDRKVKYPSAEKIMASFKREDGTSILNMNNVNLISDKKNSIFNYAKTDLVKFGYNPKHENRIWLVDEKGDIYACGNDEFRKIDRSAGQHVFVMKKLPKFETVDQFKLLTISTEVES